MSRLQIEAFAPSALCTDTAKSRTRCLSIRLSSFGERGRLKHKESNQKPRGPFTPFVFPGGAITDEQSGYFPGQLPVMVAVP